MQPSGISFNSVCSRQAHLLDITVSPIVDGTVSGLNLRLNEHIIDPIQALEWPDVPSEIVHDCCSFVIGIIGKAVSLFGDSELAHMNQMAELFGPTAAQFVNPGP
jgi:hypothetical protein